MFSFARIRGAALTGEGFEVPGDFDPQAWFDREMGVWVPGRGEKPLVVELLFDKVVGTFARDREWHSGQVVEERADGVYVKFETNQTPEVLRFVLGQGHTVKVLGPPELVDMARGEIERMRRIYGA